MKIKSNVTERIGADGRRGPDVEDGKLRYNKVVNAIDRLSRSVTAPSHPHVVDRISVCIT